MIKSIHLRLLRGAVLTMIAFVASVAFAQTAPSAAVGTTGHNTVTVTNDGTQGTVVNGVSRVSPGTASTTLTTFQLVATQGNSVQTSALPFTLSFSSGASPSHLSGCQILNSSGTVLNSGTLNSTIAGTNTITFDSPVVVTPGTAQNFALRCSVSSSAPIGSTFQVAALPGSTIFSFPGSLAVTATAIPGIQNNTVTMSNVTLGTLRLDAGASGSAIRVTSIPLSASTIGSATTGSVSGCQIFDSNGVSLNSGNVSGTLASSNSLTLNSPLIIPGGSATTLSLRCTVLPGTGGTLVLLPGAGTFNATAVTTGASVTPSITTLASAPFAIGGTITPPIVPGVPGTGLGDYTREIAVSAALALVLLAAGFVYFRTRRQNA